MLGDVFKTSTLFSVIPGGSKCWAGSLQRHVSWDPVPGEQPKMLVT